MKEELIYSTPNDIQTPIQFQNPMAYRDASNAMGQMPGISTDGSSKWPRTFEDFMINMAKVS